MQKIFLVIAVLACLIGAEEVQSQQAPKAGVKTPSKIWHGILIKKPFISKKGPTGHMEWYWRGSAQDYFIKMCYSDVSHEELKAIWDKDSTLASISAEVEYVPSGDWDRCSDQMVQSRGGPYLILKKIVK